MGIKENGLIDLDNSSQSVNLNQRRFSFIRDFEPYRRYQRDNVIYRDGIIYRALLNFHASDQFELRDWEAVTFLTGAVVVDFLPNTEIVKDTVIFCNNTLYRAKDSFITGEEFDPEDWEQVAISSVAWGEVEGDIEDQEDLQNKFDGVQNQFTNVQSQFGNVQTEFANINSEIADTNNDVQGLRNDFNAWIGRGGYLDAYNFGTAYPTQSQLSTYALSQIPSATDPSQIWNGTKVINLFDDRLWILNNTQDTNPPVFEWTVQNSLSIPPTLSQEFTFVVRTVSDLLAWANETPGNNYTSVLIKKGTYNVSFTNINNGIFINIYATRTKLIVGEEGSEITINISSGYECKVIFNNHSGSWPLHCENVNITTFYESTTTIFEGLSSANRCKAFIEEANNGTSRGFSLCKKLNNCEAYVNVPAYGGSGDAYAFANCEDLLNCIGNAEPYGYPFIGFEECDRLSNCLCEVGFAGFHNCRTGLMNRDKTGYGFWDCYMEQRTGMTHVWGNSANGGWNLMG